MTTENILKIKQYGQTVGIRASAIKDIKLSEDVYIPIPEKFIVRINMGDNFFILRKNDDDKMTDEDFLDYWIKKWESALENNSKGIFVK